MKTMKIPSGWKLCKQSDVSAFYNGRAYKLSEWETEGTPVIRLQNLTGTGNEYYYSNLKLPEHQYADDGDLLYMWSATFGPKIWQGEKAIYHYHIWKVVCKDDLLDQSFMYYNLDFITESMKSKTNGSTMLHFTKKGMEEHEILLPPLAEQEKIAKYLSTVDKKIDLIDQKIAETEKLKTGLMQKLFSEGVGVQDENGNWQPHTDFKPSGYPDCWKVMQLKSIANVITGKTPPPANTENYGGDYMFVSPSDLGSRKYISHTKSTLSKQGVNNGKVVPKGAIFFTCIGSTIGKIGISTQECCTNQQINTVILEKDGYMSEYVYYALSHISGSIKRLAGIQAVPIVKKSLFESQFIPIPPQEEQQLIAETLATVDLKLDILYKQKAETQQLKKGLMQKLLTGEWRVPVEETEAA
ncbi:hypothetical protein TUM17377_07290 [Shewanella chilikensis]|nr:hypothetical protein TUM17377_07290 [Shewanella chilikensis]